MLVLDDQLPALIQRHRHVLLERVGGGEALLQDAGRAGGRIRRGLLREAEVESLLEGDLDLLVLGEGSAELRFPVRVREDRVTLPPSHPPLGLGLAGVGLLRELHLDSEVLEVAALFGGQARAAGERGANVILRLLVLGLRLLAFRLGGLELLDDPDAVAHYPTRLGFHAQIVVGGEPADASHEYLSRHAQVSVLLGVAPQPLQGRGDGAALVGSPQDGDTLGELGCRYRLGRRCLGAVRDRRGGGGVFGHGRVPSPASGDFVESILLRLGRTKKDSCKGFLR